MTTADLPILPSRDLPEAAIDPLPEDLVDVAVLGGGAAGLNGALMLARSRRRVVVLDAGTPRNAPAEGVHGLLGHEGRPPSELLAVGRAELRAYGVVIVPAQVVSAAAEEPVDGDLRFALALADGRTVRARRVLVATGVRDELPEIPGLAQHWGHGLVHCPYCHGWEVRDQPIGILAVGPLSVHPALLFRQLSDDVVYFTRGTELEAEARARLEALGVRIVEEAITEVLATEAGEVAGVRLADGSVVERSVLAVASRLHPRLDGLEGLGLSLEELPAGMGEKVATSMAGVTGVPGVSAAGNVADPMAQVGASSAGGALAGAFLNADLVTAEADAAVRAAGAVSEAGRR